MTSSGHTGEHAIHSSDFSAFTKRSHCPSLLRFLTQLPLRLSICTSATASVELCSPRGEPPCACFIAREDPHSKCIKCLGFSHAREAVYGTSKCKIFDDFRLITLRSRLEDYERESSIVPRRASSTSAAPREIAASREVEPRALVEPRAGVRMSSSRRWRVSRQASPFLSRARTCEFAGRIFA